MLPPGPGGAPTLWRCPYWHSPATTPSARHALAATPPSPLPWHLGEPAGSFGEAGRARRGLGWGWGRPCPGVPKHPHHFHLSHA